MTVMIMIKKRSKNKNLKIIIFLIEKYKDMLENYDFEQNCY